MRNLPVLVTAALIFAACDNPPKPQPTPAPAPTPAPQPTAYSCEAQNEFVVPVGYAVRFQARQPVDEKSKYEIESNRSGSWIRPISDLSYEDHSWHDIDVSGSQEFRPSRTAYCVRAPGWWLHGNTRREYLRTAKVQSDATHITISYFANDSNNPTGQLKAELVR